MANENKEIKLTVEQQLANANKEIAKLKQEAENARLNNVRQKILSNYEPGERKNLIKYIIENSKDPEAVHKMLVKDMLTKKINRKIEEPLPDPLPDPQSYVDFNIEQPKNVKTEMTDEEYNKARFNYIKNLDNNGGW